MAPFTISFHHATPHGVLTAIHLPEGPDPVPEEVLGRLHPEEADLARTFRAYRQVQFVGGRIALREAANQLAVQAPAILPDERGCPRLPPGIVGSVSHKGDLALGMVARANGRTLGVDLEDYGPPRLSIAERILRPEELETWHPLPEGRRWIALLLRFSIKEAVYKALDPYVRRYVGFHEVSVVPDLHGWAEVDYHLKNGEGPFVTEARYDWLHGRLVTSARIAAPPGT